MLFLSNKSLSCVALRGWSAACRFCKVAVAASLFGIGTLRVGSKVRVQEKRKVLGMLSLPDTLRRLPMAAWALCIFNHKSEACELAQFHV